MATDTTQHTNPMNVDPAQNTSDPNQLNADGTPGSDAQLSDDLQTAQTGGTRSERVNQFNAPKHNIEPATMASGQPGYAPGGGGEGITTHPLSDELAEQGKLRDQTADPSAEDQLVYSSSSPEKEQSGDLPTGMAEKIETVQISSMRPKR